MIWQCIRLTPPVLVCEVAGSSLTRVWRQGMATIWASWKLALSDHSSSFCSQKNFLRCLSCVFVCFPSFFFFFSFPVWYLDEFSFPCIICAKSWCLLLDWRKVFWVVSLVFGWFWFVIKCWCHYIMYVYWSTRFVKCINKKCMHRATWSVQLVALDKAQEFQTHTLFELFCMHSAEKILARDKKHKKKGCHRIPLVYSCYCNLCVCERERESHNEIKVRDEQRARHKH